MSQPQDDPRSLPPEEVPPSPGGQGSPSPPADDSSVMMLRGLDSDRESTHPLLRPPAAPLGRVGRYEVSGQVGRGGMGEVYRGRDPDLGRDLALKVLPADLRTHPRAGERFRAEARIGGQLQHPGVVPVHELGSLDDGRPFFTMKLVKGQTLAEQLHERRNPARDRPRFLKVFEQVCQTVAYAHSRGVIHRDLKPSNIMVGAFGEVLVMDWGLAKVLGCGGTEAAETAALVSPPQTVIEAGRTDSKVDTREGDVLGTPAYMPPEQALGEVDRLDERCDVFSLGAILCELLTGRPPYVGEDGTAVLRKARRAELGDALGRLDGSGVDPELTALAKRCLTSEQDGRPRNGTEVAKAMEAYLAGVEERARQADLERAAAEVRAEGERRARRLTSGLAATVLLLVVAGGTGAWLLQQQRAETVARRAKVREAVEQARALRDEGWNEADDRKLKESLVLADKARGIAGSDAQSRQEADELHADVEGRIAAARKNGRLLVALLEVTQPRELRSYRANAADGTMVVADIPAEQQYAEAFQSWGADLDTEPQEELVRHFGEQPRPVIDQVVAGLEGWFRDRQRNKQPEARWRKLLALADALDPDAGRRELRRLRAEGRLRQHRDRLHEHARALDPRSESVLGVTTLADTLLETGEDRLAEQVLRAAVVERPGEVVLLCKLGKVLEERRPPLLDQAVECCVAARARDPRLGLQLARLLTISKRPGEAEAVLKTLGAGRTAHPELWFYLGDALREQKRLEEAVAAYRQAIALRPDYALAHSNLGITLHNQRKLGEAVAAYRQAIALRPDSAAAHNNLGVALSNQRKQGEAVAAFRQAIALEPDFALAHSSLGFALLDQKKSDEAVAACRQAIALQPDLARAHSGLGLALLAQKKPDEAVAACRQAIALQPDLALAHASLSDALREQKKLDEAVAASRKAIELQPDLAVAHSSLGAALLDQRKLDEAVAACRQAIALQPDLAEAHNYLGAALFDEKKLEEAVAAFRKAIELQPDYFSAHNNLGFALCRQKKLDEAVTAFRQADRLRPNHPIIRENLRVTERCIVLDRKLSDVLAGKAKPRHAAETLELAFFCQSFRQRFSAAAAFYRDAFALEPNRAADLDQQHRYNAACVAILAAAAKGEDAAKLEAKERDVLRKQALDWLRAELTAYAGLMEKPTPAQKLLVRQRLSHWHEDADLAAVRDVQALAALPEAERNPWRQLWVDVADLLKKVADGK